MTHAPIAPFKHDQPLTTDQSASLVRQDEVKRGSHFSEPEASPTCGGEAQVLGPEFFTPGIELPTFIVPPITRQTLALYAGASGDHNPMHIDSDFAKNGGQDDVFAHGMLVMAYLGRFLTSTFGHTRLRSWDVKFLAITRVHAELTCTATVAERLEVDGESCVRLELKVVDQTNETKLQGVALVAA